MTLKDVGSSPARATFDDSFVGKMTENFRKTPSREKKNRREIPMISKYFVFVVRTRRINSIFMSKKFSVTLTSESVTSGQAGGVFRQLFFQCIPIATHRMASLAKLYQQSQHVYVCHMLDGSYRNTPL